MVFLRRNRAYLINGSPYVFMGTLKTYKIFYGGKTGSLKVLLESDKIVAFSAKKGMN